MKIRALLCVMLSFGTIGLSQIIGKSNISSFSTIALNDSLIISVGQTHANAPIGLDVNIGFLPLSNKFLAINKLSDLQLFIYPNPFNNMINISYLDEVPAEIKFLTLNGQYLQTFKITTGINQIDLTNYARGVYLFVVIKEEKVILRNKILKQ